MAVRIPRLVIAGLSGDSGKTIVSLSILAALRKKGVSISVFKKGPDYIDSAWLGTVAHATCRNLDTYMVKPEIVLNSFTTNALNSDISLIEGNRGIFDGKDILGTHSTSELARLLKAPVILVINVTKVTRTAAAVIKGVQSFDPDVNIAGVILNKVAGKRHEDIIINSILKYCELPILGAIPRLDDDSTLIPGRHLGLVTPPEFETDADLEGRLAGIAEKSVDIDGLAGIARSAPPLTVPEVKPITEIPVSVQIGYFKDPVFTFYYPENLEALERNGAKLVPISSIEDRTLPDIDALYIGGGFPETQAKRLIDNKGMLKSVSKAAESGLPIYAECGGLIYLSGSITWDDRYHPMAGVFPIDLRMNRKPAGHGYMEIEVDGPNPFFDTGTVIRGHEFHYSALVPSGEKLESCMAVKSGSGIGNERDGLVYKNTLACFLHLHADSVPHWASAVVKRALKYRADRKRGAFEDFRLAV